MKVSRGALVKLCVGLVAIASLWSAYTFFRMSGNLARQEADCLSAMNRVLEAGASPRGMFQDELRELQSLVERSLVVRSQMLEIASELRRDPKRPLTSREIKTLKRGTEYYLALREDLYRIAQAYECAPGADPQALERHGISERLWLKALMLSLGAALTLYDNYLLGVVVFELDGRTRRILNDPDSGFSLISNKLAETTLAATSFETRWRMRRAIEFYRDEQSAIAEPGDDPDFAYLRQLIDSSPSYNYVREIRLGEIAAKRFFALERLSVDAVAELRKDGFSLLSGLFGNTVGLFESRKGKLHGNAEALRRIQSRLQPLDIILEKTPFRLTDKLIPGHFGHVAIWTGTRAELMDAQVWHHPVIQRHADLVSNGPDPRSKDGRQVIEALRSGVQLNTLEKFMNVDDLAVLRPVLDEENLQALTRESLLMAFRQLGKKYDFNFDVSTTDKIVCSELAFVSFPSVDWPVEKTLGRHSISPDNIAELVWRGKKMELVLFYHDGELVDEAEQISRLRELVGR